MSAPAGSRAGTASTRRGSATIYLSSGLFWFWEGKWWTHLEAHLERIGRPAGLQVLCGAVEDDLGLPPSEVTGRMCASDGIVLHLSSVQAGSIIFTSHVEDSFAAIRTWLENTGVRKVLLHANHFSNGREDIAEVRGRLPDCELLVENIGAGRDFGFLLEDNRSVLRLDASLGFVLDIAHLSEVRLEDTLAHWLADPLIAERLRMIHVSSSGLAHSFVRRRVPPEIGSADHLPAFLYAAYPGEKARRMLASYPLITEGCLPHGDLGLDWLELEKESLAGWSDGPPGLPLF